MSQLDQQHHKKLQLPHNWTSHSAGALVAYVLDQLDDESDMRTVGRMFMLAALDLTVSARWSRLRSDLRLVERADGLWTFGEAAYAYVATSDEETVDLCLSLVMWSINVHVIVPPDCDHILRVMLDRSIGRLRPVILSLTDFLNTHTSNAIVDGRLTYRNAVMRIMEAYNRNQIVEGCDDDGLLIDLPWEPLG